MKILECLLSKFNIWFFTFASIGVSFFKELSTSYCIASIEEYYNNPKNTFEHLINRRDDNNIKKYNLKL